MKHIFLLALLTAVLFAQPGSIRTVYILPMAGGLDQYLAQWLTRDHVMQVVTDPKAADAVMTDRLGEGFEQKMTQIFPGETEKKTDKKDEAGSGGSPHTGFRSTTARGTIFLVDPKTRQVVWSDYEKPPYPSDASLNREAQRIVKKLQEKPGK